MTIPAAISDYRELAQKRLPQPLFDFIDGGAFNEVTIKQNSKDFDHILLHKKVLRDVSSIDTSINLFGQTLKQPMILAPIGYAGLFGKRGEIQAAKAAEASDIPFCLSMLGICSIEEVRQSTKAPFWFQLYMLKDKGLCLNLLHRAQAAGCPTLIVTVDVPVVGIRYRDIRNGMSRNTAATSFSARFNQLWDICSHPRWACDVALGGRPLSMGNFSETHWKESRKWVQAQVDLTTTWKDLEWVRAHWPGKLIVKGILDPDDGRKAVGIGSDGIVVSNHAGRHLDSLPSSISMLRGIVEIVNDAAVILFDGGIGSGLDVIKALALGATACMIGRPWAFALGARGEQGVREVLSILQKEIETCMAQLGVTSISEINSSILSKRKT